MLLSLSIFSAPGGLRARARVDARACGFMPRKSSFPLARCTANSIYLPLLPVYHQPETMVCWKRLWLWKSRLSSLSCHRQTFASRCISQSIELTLQTGARADKSRTVTPVKTAARSNKSLTSFSPYCLSWRSGGCEQCLVLLKATQSEAKKPSREMRSRAGWRQCKIPPGFRPSGISPLGFKAQLKAGK